MRRIAVINQKGGVGKTTTCCNVGAALAAAGQRVLLIDLDPQAHLTMHLGVEPSADRPSIYDVLTDSVPVADTIVPIGETLYLVPSHIDLAAAEMELVSVMGREVILCDALESLEPTYDFVMIDCPPSLGVLTVNGLAAMREVLVPMQPHFLALQGVGKLLETIQLVKGRINTELVVSGIVLCMYDAGTRLAGEVSADLAQFIEASRGTDVPWANSRIFETIIRRNIKLAECPSHGLTIANYAPSSNGAADYAALAAELLGVDALPVRPVTLVEAHEVQEEPDASHEPDGSLPAAPLAAFDADGRTAFGPDDSPEPATVSSADIESAPEQVAEAVVTEVEAVTEAEAEVEVEVESSATGRDAPEPSPSEPSPHVQRMSIPIQYEEDGSSSSPAASEVHHG